MQSRIERLRARMREANLPALLVTRRENIFYLSGFSGSAGALLVTEDQALLATDFRYYLQVAQEAPGWTLLRVETALLSAVTDAIRDLGVQRIGFDPTDVSVAQYEELGGTSAAPYALIPAPGMVEALRLIKEPAELALIREAVRLTDEAYRHLTEIVRPGITELEMALEAEWHMRRNGADAIAFDIIIAAGEHGALPHAHPSNRALQAGDLVVIDMGARYAHYCADMSRTFAVGEASDAAREIYRICAEAQQAGLDGLQAGMTGHAADALTRDVITAAGYGPYFGHGTGHGVGLYIHEAPRLRSGSTDLLPTGCVVTVEPGIYLPEVGGVRIEDLVVVTPTGVEVLTAAPKPTHVPIFG